MAIAAALATPVGALARILDAAQDDPGDTIAEGVNGSDGKDDDGE